MRKLKATVCLISNIESKFIACTYNFYENIYVYNNGEYLHDDDYCGIIITLYTKVHENIRKINRDSEDENQVDEDENQVDEDEN